jgi:cellulose synthase (UDP-forming)
MINKDLRPTSSARLQSVLQAIAGKIGRLSPGMQRWLKICALMLAALLLAFTVSVPLDLYSQCVFGIGCFVVALMLRRHTGRFQVLLLIALSLTISLRYMFWRVSSTLAFENWGDVIFGYALLAAEIYSLVVLCLGYLQTAWPLQRKPQLMTGPPSEWPTVDIFIPTYNESLDIVSLTILASQAIDWPKDKLRVHVLDDGRREEFRQFCDSAGVNYLTRDNNRHAKAGNLNEALKLTDGEFVAIFDADHVPTRSFLQICLGWFRKDVNLAMLQTPHFFFSPDPFEKNLNTFRSVPNEGELFYGLVQDGNDLWNATFFCGSCAVMRRSALMEIGGIAVETLTEDAHTALKMSRAGYNTAYLAIPQAAGLATESLARHIRQRVRWARGMAQIFRIDNPLIGKGLTFGQRLCYLNAMLHFFYGLPRLIFLTAPLTFLFFGAHIFHASALMICAYVLPHVLQASLTNSMIQKQFRHSFWNEVYETVLAWYIMWPVLLAMVNPKLGGFNVTGKGGVINDKHFDWKLARPYIILLMLNVAGLLFGFWQLATGVEGAQTTILINLVWTLYNVMISGASMAVASETRQVRNEPRVAAELPVRVQLADGSVIDGFTMDFSQKGIGLRLPEGVAIQRGEHINVTLFLHKQEHVFPAIVVFNRGEVFGAQFNALSLHQQSQLVRLTFSRADIWASSWGRGRPDTPLASLREVALVGVHGVKELVKAALLQLREVLAARRQSSPKFDNNMEKQ